MSADKIDNSLSFKGFPQEKLLTVEFVRDRDGREFWLLSKRIIVKNYPAKVIFHKDETFIGIIVWIAMNRIFQKDYTRLEIQSGIHAVDPNYIRDLVTELSVHFAFKRLQIQNSYFVRDPFRSSTISSSIRIRNIPRKSTISSSSTTTAGGRPGSKTYKSEVDIARIATAVLNGALVTRHDYERALRLSSSQPYGSSRDFDRINSLLRGMHALFVEDRTPARKRYVTMLGNTWFVFSNRKTMAAETVVATPFDAEAKMLFGLGANTGALARYGFDPMIPELNYLRKIAENRGEDVIRYISRKRPNTAISSCPTSAGLFTFSARASILSTNTSRGSALQRKHGKVGFGAEPVVPACRASQAGRGVPTGAGRAQQLHAHRDEPGAGPGRHRGARPSGGAEARSAPTAERRSGIQLQPSGRHLHQRVHASEHLPGGRRASAPETAPWRLFSFRDRS